jgi:hypothetical protein
MASYILLSWKRKQLIGKKDTMVGTKHEIIEKLITMLEIESDETILIDLWTMKDFAKCGAVERSDEFIIQKMHDVDNDMKNEISYATVTFAMNV